MTILPIPEKLTKAILFLRGQEDGARWLRELPGTLEHFAREWDLRLDVISDGGAMSACAIGVDSGGSPVVLKVPVDPKAGRHEALLLDYWRPTSAVPAVIYRNAETGVFLMDRVLPGDTAWPTGRRDDSERYADLLMRLNEPNPSALPLIRSMNDVSKMRMGWARERFQSPENCHPKADLIAAQSVLERLEETSEVVKCRVLHADLQAKNVLTGNFGLFAIDPMGALGDVNAEAALWIAIQDGPASIEDRVADLAKHPLLDPDRLAAWTYVYSVAEYRRHLRLSGERIERHLAIADPARLRRALRRIV